MLTAFPAITCDVAVLHALEADRAGNARLNANWGIDRELSVVAKNVIVTAEEIVDQIGGEAQVLAPVVTAVVHAPRGAWPTSCYPCYPLGGGELMRYVDECAAGRFAPYLEELLTAP
jgi:glutaconate CoA-transferase subunit A